MTHRVLHVLSQRPAQTGSGITLAAVVTRAQAAGWRQAAAVGVPADLDPVTVGTIPQADIHPLTFAPDTSGGVPGTLSFPLPGMSDVMPYASSVWSRLTAVQLTAYREAWRVHLRRAIAIFRPDLIHTNHIWLVSALLRELAPDRPILVNCHATGLRQMDLCPQLAAEVVAGCRGLDHFCVLRRDHQGLLANTLEIPRERITVTGAGYRDDVFHRPVPETVRPGHSLLYVGKFSRAKGLPWLLDAVERLAADYPDLRLHVAGSGTGPEAEDLHRRMLDLAPRVQLHGQVDQARLGDIMRACQVMVLPSFYEGVPLVLVEAAACGCRLVATALPGVVEQIAPALAGNLTLVPLPRLRRVDTPVAADLPGFVDDLEAGLRTALAAGESPPPPNLAPFTWQAVWQRVEALWLAQLGGV